MNPGSLNENEDVQLKHEAPGEIDETLRVPLLIKVDSDATPSGTPYENVAETARQDTQTSIHVPAINTTPVYVAPQPVLQDPVAAGLSGGYQDVGRFWHKQRPFQTALVCVSLFSVATFMLMDMGSGIFLAAEMAGIIAMVAPICALIPNYTGNLDIASLTKLSYNLGVVAGALDTLTLIMVDMALLSLLPSCENDPEEASSTTPSSDADDYQKAPQPMNCVVGSVILVYLTLLLGGHAWLSFKLARQGKRAQQLLNPVSSGMIEV
ncbi:hypothetical protein CEUSTIGMA_g681.t1 [Chlamydomonas eustigma]|uniref:Uncharacterized protein n=1 Tax=Chlamydomonas eustigma TaxID=1157962 RepID=A0A250WQX9_9CHLO|nr:hypothetical protein CEUSTIGMA_g681.t1 [Chlamydomonas eustigma]|eukprot:GAX73228.1 hypothetical protein CEUSTIGMA_g681.t1 [Chlamydomonas eustigma]